MAFALKWNMRLFHRTKSVNCVVSVEFKMPSLSLAPLASILLHCGREAEFCDLGKKSRDPGTAPVNSRSDIGMTE